MRTGSGTAVEEMDGRRGCLPPVAPQPKTLQGMRDRGIVACSQVGRKFYYRTEDVERLVSEKREETP